MLGLPRRAMLDTRTAARAGIRQVLMEYEAESIENRARERFDENVRKSLVGLLE